MKIDDNLRAAIRSTCKMSQRQDRKGTANAYKAAVDKFIAKNQKSWNRRVSALMKADAACKTADATAALLREEFERVGLSPWNLPEIQLRDPELFVKAGGDLPVAAVAKDSDTIIAKLAAATTAEGAVIIKELGINWE